MKRKFTLFFIPVLLLLLQTQIHAQKKIDHWEMVFHPYVPLKYYSLKQAPEDNWKDTNYVINANWKDGMNMIDCGGLFGSSQFSIPFTNTIYTRTTFTIIDTSTIESLIFNINYLDGIVAYLNGTEILRTNLGAKGSKTTYEQYSDSAQTFGQEIYEIYYGFKIDKEVLRNTLKNGDNLLCVEQHNDGGDKLIGFYTILYAAKNNSTQEYITSYPQFPLPIESDSSNLPIVKISFPDNAIPDDTRITAKLEIINNGEGKYNHISDKANDYDGTITIERRGSASQMFAKRSYGFSTIGNDGKEIKVSLLGCPEESDWIFKGEIEDRTLLRDKLSFHLMREMGRYAPRTKYCEVYVNNVHMGLFTLMEKIKRDSLRVDIAKLKNTDNFGLDVTGGYIIKLDKTTGSGGDGWNSQFACPKQSLKPYLQYEYPKSDKITTEQKTYIKDFINNMENTLRSTNYKDPINGYRKYMAVNSFIDYMIIEELSKNVDGYRLSTYMYKEKDKVGHNGKLHMGPIWDFNLAYGYSGELCKGKWAADSTDGWGYDYNATCPGDNFYIPFWWDRLLQDESFRDSLKARWDELRMGPLHKDTIINYIDSIVAKTKSARERNFKIWENVFQYYIWPNNPIADDYDGEIAYLKKFISNRIDWLDKHFPEIHEEIIYTDIQNSVADIGQVRVYPIPFKENVTIEYTTKTNQNIALKIYDTQGKMVYSAQMRSSNGKNTIQWDGTYNGKNANPGIYLYTLELNNKIVVKSKIAKY